MSARGRYYDPPLSIKAVPGVERTFSTSEKDYYTGSAEALASAGLLPLHLFPGQPGQPSSMVTYRPNGGKYQGRWWKVPGYMSVRQTRNGTFCIALTVDFKEQARRKAEGDAQRQREIEEGQRRMAEMVMTDSLRAGEFRRQVVEALSRSHAFAADALVNIMVDPRAVDAYGELAPLLLDIRVFFREAERRLQAPPVGVGRGTPGGTNVVQFPQRTVAPVARNH